MKWNYNIDELEVDHNYNNIMIHVSHSYQPPTYVAIVLFANWTIELPGAQ